MAYTSALDGFDAQEQARVASNRIATRARVGAAPLRFGGLTFDPTTGATHWRGKTVALSVQDRELLGALMRSAGRIVSRERLAAAMSGETGSVDAQMTSLRSALKDAGVMTLPCTVEGQGYILWRS